MQSIDFDDKYDEIDLLIKEVLLREADKYEKVIEKTDHPEHTDKEIQESYNKLMMKIDERKQK